MARKKGNDSEADDTANTVSSTPPEEASATSSWVEIARPSVAQERVAKVERRLSELPDLPKTMNTVSVVLAYKMFGLADAEVALALDLTTQQVARVQALEAYALMQDEVMQRMQRADSDEIRSALHENAQIAARRQRALLLSEDEKVAASMVKDALDRDGYRPADVVEHRVNMSGGLVLEVLHREDKDDTIDVEFDNVPA